MAGDPADQLLLIDLVNAHGVVILQTIWAPADALRFGRQTRTENITTQAQLRDRLLELVPLIAGALPLVAPAELGDNVVVVDLAGPPGPPVAEIAGPVRRRTAA